MDRIEIVGMVLLAVVGQVYAEQWTNPRSYLGETWYYFQDGSGVCVNGVSGGRYENTTSLMFDMNQYGFPNTVISIEGFSNEKWTGADFGRLTALSNVRNGAFRGCQSLENVQGLPSTVTNIGAYAFANCKKLSMCNVVHETRKGITRGIKSIREGAFSNCDFTWVTIPSTTVSVGNLAFSGCSRLQYAYVPTTCQISDNAFSNCKSTFRLIRYKPNQVVSFVDRGQTLPDKITANFAVPYGTLPTLSREGYEFVGWLLDGSSIGDLCYALEDHTLTAQWQVNKYKVIFNANGGDGGITNELDYATEIVVPNVSRVGYVFCGWLPEIDATVPASNVTYMAQWQIDQSVITSDARDYGITAYTNAEWVGDSSVSHDGGESLRSGLIDKNQSSWLEATVSGAGRISFWWKVSSEYWGEDIFDYAYLSVDGVPQGTWSNRRLCGVAIGGATDWTNVIFDVVGEGAHVIRWTYCKDEEDDGECGQDCLWLDEFSFTPKVKVAFDVGDGSEGELPDSIHVLAGESIILPTATFSWVDHVFNGWTDGTANYAAGADYVVPETNVTLVAIWIAKRFLTFTLDGGDGEIPITIKDVPNATVTLPGGEGLHKAKHAFIGWSDGTQTYDPGAEYVVTDSSVEFNAVWAANSLVAPTISSADVMTGGTIETASATIEMTADSGTAIYYTLDGTEPTTNSIPYAAPFVADGMDVTIKAFAVKDDYFDSPAAEFAFSRKPYSAAECINAYGKAVSTDSNDAAWGRVLGVAAHDGVAALRSGVIGEGGTSSVEMSVDGVGEIGFWWKASCERVIRGEPKDHVAFYVDGVSQCWMGGLTDWSNVVVSVSGEGSHVLKWVYQKDSNEKTENEDCAWLDEVTWTSMDPIPVIASDGELAAALTGTADANVSANVTNAVQYAAYRDWALSVTNGTTTAQMIKESTRTWLSYALGADALIGKEITSNDVRIVAFEAANADSGAMGSSRPTFAFEVAIDGVNIGGGSVAVETLKENLKKVLGIEGAATLAPGTFSSDNIDITFDTPVDGKARFTVSPPADAGNSFFMRVRVK